MDTLLLLAILAAVVAVLVVVLKQRRERSSRVRRKDPLANDPMLYDPHKIAVGDVITYAGVDHVVRGTLALTEGGITWKEHLLDGSSGRRWLGVEDDEGDLEMVMWVRREGTGLEPGGDIVLDDRVHRRVEHGRAQYVAEGTTGTPESGTVEWHDYKTADGVGLVAFERWAPTLGWEVSVGHRISPGELTVYHSAEPGKERR